jgi:hypothetical protein
MVHNKLVPAGFEAKNKHIKSNMQFKIITMQTYKCVPYSYVLVHMHTHMHMHTQSTEGVGVHEILR